VSTIKSSDEHLTLNADGSSKDIKFQANGVEKASISSAGAFTSTTIDATKLTGDVPDASFPSTLPAASAANLTAIPAANITGALPAISGANLTGITTGKVLAVYEDTDVGEYDTNSTSFIDVPGLYITATPSATSSKFLVLISMAGVGTHSSCTSVQFRLERTISGVGTTNPYTLTRSAAHDAITNSNVFGYDVQGLFLDEPSTTTQTTWKVQIATAGAGYARINSNMGTNDVTSSIVVMEIGA
jgi:hypothetical protein